MYIDLNPSAIGVSVSSVDQLIRLAVDHGFEGIDLPLQHVSSREAAERAGENVSQARLKWGLFGLPCDFLRVDDEGYEKGFARLKEIAPIAQAAGCRRAYNHVWPGSDEREWDANWQWHVDRLKRLVDLLGKHDIHLGIEFIGPKTLQDTFEHRFIRTLAGAVKLADAVSPDLGIVLDTFHWYTSDGTLDDLREELTGGRVVNVHVNDAVPNRPRDEQLDTERALPMATDVIDAPGVLRVLRELGYEGPVMAEPFLPEVNRLRELLADEAAEEVGRCMQRLMEASRGPSAS